MEIKELWKVFRREILDHPNLGERHDENFGNQRNLMPDPEEIHGEHLKREKGTFGVFLEHCFRENLNRSER